MADTYKTLVGASEATIREKMSKFIAFAIPVDSVEKAKEQIALYQKEYFDARHVCWAYMIGADRATYQSNDNGEPSGTAGKPILGQINSFGLTNVVIIVVRYFGGIKLGTSGLIAAYREAARQAICEGVIEERHEMQDVMFSFPYEAMNDVMKLTKDDEVKVLDRSFDNICHITLSTRSDNMPGLRGRITAIDGTKIIE